ncbi:alpha/beta hydrolase [Mycobacterium sp. 852002-51163_SCH5372311]|uniref:alpha/beta hydrolase n=1 Tax=Mycobacterium sp. 852002-51163_SCH5372311 TaxID=1834097 RepID=UPI0007FE4525|nr:alpha/beta hydrolase [Mycobacterium sp. 852002-51163_SCH5372311]OBF92687.1 alpha/beta hydrolase [Mycobacterium sp. 852002-51163_SCH5372311]
MVDDFHPDLRRIARFTPSRVMRMTPRTLPIARTMVAMTAVGGPRDVEVVSLGPGVGVRVHRPAGRMGPVPGLLWIHGGCYVIGCAAQNDKLCRRFARAVGAVVASVEYRVAPEYPYPAALDDCETALEWLLAQPAVDSSRVAIGGGSAGGGLAAALALRLRDQGSAAQPVIQLLTYPMLDDRPAFRPDPEPERRRMMDQGMNRFGWKSYLRGADPNQAVPARATDLTGLPPAWIGVGTRDLLFTESHEYADRLKNSGVPCVVEVVEGAFHGFDLLAPKKGVSRRFFESQCAALSEAIGRPS